MRYLTIYASKRIATTILDDLARFNWELKSRQDVYFRDSLNIIGPYNPHEGQMVSELTLCFDDKKSDHELLTLTDIYLEAKDKQLNSFILRKKGLVTGMVFGSIMMALGFIFFFIYLGADRTPILLVIALFLLISGFAAIPLGLWGIDLKKKHLSQMYREATSKIEETLLKAKNIR